MQFLESNSCVLESQLSRFSLSRLLNLFMPYLKVQTELVLQHILLVPIVRVNTAFSCISLENLFYLPSFFLSLSVCLCLNSLYFFFQIYFPPDHRCAEKRGLSPVLTVTLGGFINPYSVSLSIMKSSLLCLWNTLGIQFASPYTTSVNCFLYEQFLHSTIFFLPSLTFSTIGP